MATLNVTGTVRDSAGLTTPYTGTIITSGGQTAPINIGEPFVLSQDDSGNANLLLAQRVTLDSPGVLQSLSFYVVMVAGQIRLGIYNLAGTLIAQTAAFTPVVGWNTKLLTGNLPAGDYWLAYTPSSNSLHFRVGAGGSAKSATRTFGAMPTTFPTTGITTGTNHWSFYATVLVDQAVVPPPGKITTFVSTAANWDNPSVIDGRQWFNHNGGRAWSLTKVDDFTVRMEIRQGDPEAIDVGGERSEISGGFGWTPASQLIDFQYNMLIEPGASLNSPKASWCSVLQVHGDVRNSFILMDGETMVVVGNPDSGPGFEWRDPTPIVRNRIYKMRFQIKRGTNGTYKFWRDDVLLLNFAGVVSGTDNYLKLGIYRGDPGSVPQTMAARYSNITILA